MHDGGSVHSEFSAIGVSARRETVVSLIELFGLALLEASGTLGR